MADDFLADQLYDTWRINNRINLYLLDAVPAEHLSLKLKRGRTVGGMFAHIYNIHRARIEYAAKELLAELPEVAKEQAEDKELLRQALTASGVAVDTLLHLAVANGGKVKNFKPHAVALIGYLIAHDAHTRAEITFVLTESGHKLDDLLMYGLWDWKKRGEEM